MSGIEETLTFHQRDIDKLQSDLADINTDNIKTIVSITKINTVGLTDTYRILFSDSTYTDYNVANGEDGTNGVSIIGVSKISTVGLVDTYRISFSNSTHTDYTITNGADGTNETASSLLNKLKTVDGSGSGLDADLFDGLNSSDFLKTINADNIQIEGYSNGIRIKKDNDYIHSMCWGIVEMTTTGSNGTALTTVNFPFTFNSAQGVQTSIVSGNPLMQNGSNTTLSNNSVNITVQRTTAGTSGVRWYAYGI